VRREIDREEQLARAGSADQQREATERDSAEPKPRHCLRLHVSHAHDVWLAAGANVRPDRCRSPLPHRAGQSVDIRAHAVRLGGIAVIVNPIQDVAALWQIRKLDDAPGPIPLHRSS